MAPKTPSVDSQSGEPVGLSVVGDKVGLGVALTVKSRNTYIH